MFSAGCVAQNAVKKYPRLKASRNLGAGIERGFNLKNLHLALYSALHALLHHAVFLQVLLFVFSILRKVAWDYGRLALVTDADR